MHGNAALLLDPTGRFLTTPVPNGPGQARGNTLLHQHLAWLERVCGN